MAYRARLTSIGTRTYGAKLPTTDVRMTLRVDRLIVYGWPQEKESRFVGSPGPFPNGNAAFDCRKRAPDDIKTVRK
jgi:hypothetical protein